MKDINTKQRKQMIKRMAGRDELNFLQAFIILVITLVLFTVIFPLAQRAMDIQSLQTCEVYGDCAEVIKHINE